MVRYIYRRAADNSRVGRSQSLNTHVRKRGCGPEFVSNGNGTPGSAREVHPIRTSTFTKG